MADFREPEFHDNGWPTISFCCFDPMCGKEDGHSLKIIRLPGMDMNICAKSLPVKDITGLIDAGISVYPPFGLVAAEVRAESLLDLFSK